MTTTLTGIPTLRKALRRARALGATITTTHGGAILRVEAEGRSVQVNRQRHDATPELVALVAALEARSSARRILPTETEPTPIRPAPGPTNGAAPTNGSGPPPIARVSLSYAERIRRHLRAIPPDAAGWRHFGSAPEIAAASGVPVQSVSTHLTWIRQTGKAELYREGKGYQAVRYLDEEPTPAPIAVVEGHREVDATGSLIPETPHLAAYAQARKLVAGSDLLEINLDEAKVDEILEESVRLFYWIRAGKK